MTMKQQILSAGLELWESDPQRVTARGIARVIGCFHGTVLHHFGSAELLKQAIAQHAVECGNTRIIAYLIATGNDAIKHLPADVREAHLRTAANA